MQIVCVRNLKQLVFPLLAIFILTSFGCANRYAAIRQELENKNYEVARKQILDTWPHDAHYNMLLAEVSYYLEDYDAFVDAASRSLRQSDEFRDDLLYLLKLADIELTEESYNAFERRRYSEARHLIDLDLRVRYYLDWVLTPFADRALSVSEMLEYSSESLVKEGRYDEARTHLLHLTADSMRSLNVHERLAYIYYASGQFNHSNDLIKEIMTPQKGGAGILLFNEELRQVDYLTDSLLTDYDPLIRERELIERPMVDSHLGSSFYGMDDWLNSRFRFEMVLKTEPGNEVGFLSLIAESYFYEGNFEKAAEVFEQALLVEPQNEDVVQYLAICRFNMGERVAADSLFAVAREIDRGTVMTPRDYAPVDTTRIQLERP